MRNSNMVARKVFIGAALLSAVGVVSSLQGQAPVYRYTNPYAPAPYTRESALTGAANVINANSQTYVTLEQARIEREKANQAKLQTKRATFDEMMYENANKVSYTEKAEYDRALLIRRIMNEPSKGEVERGDAQNTLMDYARNLMSQGITGPPVPIDPYLLNSINVTGPGATNVGLLKGPLEWPLVLQGKEQENIEKQLTVAVTAAATGKMTQKLYTDIRKEVEKLSTEHTKKFRKEEIDGGDYLAGKRFLDHLETSVKTLNQPGVKAALTASNRPEGRNVPELVSSMTAKGMRFAPASPGTESAYFGLQTALVAYANGAQESPGFRTRFGVEYSDAMNPYKKRPGAQSSPFNESKK